MGHLGGLAHEDVILLQTIAGGGTLAMAELDVHLPVASPRLARCRASTPAGVLAGGGAVAAGGVHATKSLGATRRNVALWLTGGAGGVALNRHIKYLHVCTAAPPSALPGAGDKGLRAGQGGPTARSKGGSTRGVPSWLGGGPGMAPSLESPLRSPALPR